VPDVVKEFRQLAEGTAQRGLHCGNRLRGIDDED
jgi:hypothetical protein